MWEAVKMVMFFSWSLLLSAAALALPSLTQALQVEELTGGAQSSLPLPVYPAPTFRILNAEPLLLREAGPDGPGSASPRAQRQVFALRNASGPPPPAVSATYGPVTTETAVPPQLLQTGPRIRAFVLARQVRSSAPIVRVLFYAARRAGDPLPPPGQGEGGRRGGYICVVTYAFWESREVRGACALPAQGGSCLARLKPEPAWFGPGGGRGGGRGPGGAVELFYSARPGASSSQCSPQDGAPRRAPPGQAGAGAAGRYGTGGPRMRRIGSLALLRSPPGNPTLMRLRLGGSVVVQTSSKPVRTADTATFYIFLPSASPVERFSLRSKVSAGLSFRGARPSDSALWDISVEPEREAGEPQGLYVVCQKKNTLSGKRGLLEVLQLDFEAEELSDQSEGQLVTWQLELPGNVKDEGSMRVYTTQKDFIGLAPLITDPELLNTAILTGKMMSFPVSVLAVEADGSVTDITNFTSCQSTDTDILKVSERCDYVFVNGKETGGRVRMLVNFTYSYLSAQLEVSVWTPRLPLHIELSDAELSQIKGWRVPVSASGHRKAGWDSEEEDEVRKGRGCMLQYQHARVRVLTAFLADGDDDLAAGAGPGAGPAAGPPTYFLGPDWQVDVTLLVQDSLRVADATVARLQGPAVLAGRAAGVTTLQVLSPLSDSVLGERQVRVLDDRVSITELGLQLVSGLSLNLQLSPGSNRAIVATATTRELMQSPKQEALISPWVQFSDGSLTSLDLYDPSSYTLSASSLDERVVSVRRGPPPELLAVAQGDGQGLLLRAELGICEACQKSKRKSKLAAGSGAVRVELLPVATTTAEEEDGEPTAGTEGGAVAAPGPGGDAPLPEEEEEEEGEEARPPRTSPRAMPPLDAYTRASPPASRPEEPSTSSTRASTRTSTPRQPSPPSSPTGVAPTVAPSGRGKEVGNLLLNSISHLGPDGPQGEVFRKSIPKGAPPNQEAPSEEPPAQDNDLVRALGVAFSDLEICIYALVGVSCVAILCFLLNCATYSLRSRGKKSPVQPAEQPDPHRHHWVRLGTQGSEQGRPPPPPRPLEVSPLPPLAPAPPAAPPPERTATLGRRSSSCQLPSRTNSLTGGSATLLARPVRTEPLHSPTSKRNQVQFTTFTTLDIKHLAALKRNGLEVSWAAPLSSYVEPRMGPLPDAPYPTVRPHPQA